MAATKKEIAKSIKTLLVMLQSIRNQQVTITLRNDTLVRGTILKVDDCMNIELQNATIEKDPFYCTNPRVTLKSDLVQVNSSEEADEDGEDITESIHESDSDSEVVYADNILNVVGKNIEDQEAEDLLEDSLDATAAAAAAATNDGGDLHEDNKSSSTHDYLIVKGSRIRHIDLPTDCDLVASTKCEIQRIRDRRKQWTKRDIVARTTPQSYGAT